jgi:hypothetical protein
VHDIEVVDIFHACDYLLEKFAGLRLFDASIADDEIKQLTTGCVLHDEIELLGSLDDLNSKYLVELDDLRMPNLLQDLYFTCNSLYVCDITNSLLFKYFHRHLLSCKYMRADFDLTKRALSYGFA